MRTQKRAGADSPGGTSPAIRPNSTAWCVNQLSGPLPKKAHAVTAPTPSTARVAAGPLSIHHQDTGARNPISLLPRGVQSSHGSGQTIAIESAIICGFHSPPKRINACTPKAAATMPSGGATRRTRERNI